MQIFIMNCIELCSIELHYFVYSTRPLTVLFRDRGTMIRVLAVSWTGYRKC